MKQQFDDPEKTPLADHFCENNSDSNFLQRQLNEIRQELGPHSFPMMIDNTFDDIVANDASYLSDHYQPYGLDSVKTP